MINAELLKYIEVERKLGKTDEVIRSVLIEAGWNEDDLNLAFNKTNSINGDDTLSPLGYLWRILLYSLFFIFIWYFSWNFLPENIVNSLGENSGKRIFPILIAALLTLILIIYKYLRKKIINKTKINFKKDILNKKNIITFLGTGCLSVVLIFIVLPAIAFFLFLWMCSEGGGC